MLCSMLQQMTVTADVITFRNGITNGLKGKFVASWSFAWNSSIDKWEFQQSRKQRFFILSKNIIYIIKYIVYLLISIKYTGVKGIPLVKVAPAPSPQQLLICIAYFSNSYNEELQYQLDDNCCTYHQSKHQCPHSLTDIRRDIRAKLL